MYKASKFRLYPDTQQTELLNKHFGCTRFIKNWSISKNKESLEKKKGFIFKSVLEKELILLKKEHIWLKEVNSQSLQQALAVVDKSFQEFFAKKKGFPNFHKKSGQQSFKCTQSCSVEAKNKVGLLSIPKFKTPIKLKLSKEIKGNITSLTISKSPSGKFFVSIITDFDYTEPQLTTIDKAQTVGIDVGIKNFLTLSNGEVYENKKFFKELHSNLAIKQKIFSRKKKESKNYERQRKVVAKAHEKIKSKRLNYIHNVTNILASKNQATTYCVEDLKINNMMKNKKLSKAISDVSWGMFLKVLNYKLKLVGKNLLTVDTFYASSKICNACGDKNNNLILSTRNWTCSCGVSHDRDLNAAINIRNEGLAITLGLSGA